MSTGELNRFNPRSSRSRGATLCFCRLRRPQDGVSTHAPRVHEERRRHAAGLPGRRRVSTHAPRIHEERLPPCPRTTPRCGFNPRSPRSRGATARLLVIHSGSQAFQPAFTRSDQTDGDLPHYDLFQPTLPAFTRSDRAGGGAGPGAAVSTHAPRVHEERLTYSTSTDQYASFQPTLPAFTRSDPGHLLARARPVNVSTHAPGVHEERPRPRP